MTPEPFFGRALLRREDPALLCGEALFLADLDASDALHAVFVRSSVAHGRLIGADLSTALGEPGVVAAFTAQDLGLPDIPEWPLAGAVQRPELARPCLARDRVRFVGEAVAVVVAASPAQAVDAAEQVVLDIDPLPVVVDPIAALGDDAPVLFPEVGTNLAVELHLETGWEHPTLDGANDGATDVANDGATDSAEVIVNERFYNQRLAPAPMEPNGALVRPLQDGTLECHMSCQAPFFVRGAIARALGRPEESVRVIAPAVGGGFGAKGGVYPEQIVVSALAERLGRTVRWVETRSENLVAMTHGRGQVQELRLTGRRDGTLTALVARTVTELGAYCARGVIGLRTSRLMSTGPYRIPRLSLTSLGVLTNTTPTGPYRGAGRPEATAMLERAIDIFAREVGLDAVDVRRRNLLRKEELPTIAPSGASYDSGDYVGALDEVLRLAGYDELRRDQAERRGSGCDRQIGIGVSTFVEVSGVGSEYGAVMIDRDGSVAVLTGSSPHGQGHETTLAQIAADALSVPIGSVRVVHSDTGLVANGTGTFGSRSGQLGGGAVAVASQRLLAQARELAGELLEASARDVVSYDGGRFGVAGVPARTLSLEELAGAAVQKGGLSAEAELTQSDGTYPFGAHLAVVEVERSTGRVELVRLVAVDDCGNVLNPLIVEGQVHGGLAQGVAQALFEGVRYDDMGNPLTSTLADYLVPSAAELPFFETGQTVTPSPRNPLGMKGIGESGTVGAAAAVQNAVLDALAPDGVLHIDMPLTPERVWRAIRGLPAKSCG